MTDTRPANCRNRLEAEGKPHPKSGCAVNGCSLFSRVCDRPEPLPINSVKINHITQDDVACFDQNIEMDDTASGRNALDQYQEIATQSANYPGRGTSLGLVYITSKAACEAGEMSQHVLKAMRDDGFLDLDIHPDTGYPRVYDHDNLTPERRNAIIKEIGDELWYLAAACNELDIKLSDAAKQNLENLAGRTKRDTLRGSGDDR